MDFENYNNDENGSDEDYERFVEWLENLTSAELQQAKGDFVEQKKALCRYYKRGEKANFSPAELIDFLGVSYPSILSKAGYSDQESAALFEISDALTRQEIESADLEK